jgi:hypothetical protein
MLNDNQHRYMDGMVHNMQGAGWWEQEINETEQGGNRKTKITL